MKQIVNMTIIAFFKLKVLMKEIFVFFCEISKSTFGNAFRRFTDYFERMISEWEPFIKSDNLFSSDEDGIN